MPCLLTSKRGPTVTIDFVLCLGTIDLGVIVDLVDQAARALAALAALVDRAGSSTSKKPPDAETAGLSWRGSLWKGGAAAPSIAWRP